MTPAFNLFFLQAATMMYERFDEALVGTIKIEDITPKEQNQKILQRLKDNEAFDTMWICDDESADGDHRDYVPIDGEDLGWLGYYIGQNTSLMQLHMCSDVYYNGPFYKGLGSNKTIRIIKLSGMYLSDGQALKRLDQFFKNNGSLTVLAVENCDFNEAGIRHLSLAIGNCNKSLKRISIKYIEDGNMVDIITACSMHPQLKTLELCDVNIRRNECTALSTLLQHTTTQLNNLDLHNNNIDDKGVEDLVNALANGNKLELLDLSNNKSITIKGWKKVSTLLKSPSSTLKRLAVDHNNIGNTGAQIFATSLVNNVTCKALILCSNGITDEGWEAFSNLLCDTSSPNKTYLSNHSLETIHGLPCRRAGAIAIANNCLNLNKRGGISKQEVAMSKILWNHSQFNMQPFFEWEFKVLPIMIEWFVKAAACTSYYHKKRQRIKLSVTFDFIREFPMLYIEHMTKKEVLDYTLLEERLQEDESQQEKLEEIRQRKTHALMRLS